MLNICPSQSAHNTASTTRGWTDTTDPTQGVNRPPDEFRRALMMEIATTIPFSKSGSHPSLYSRLLTALTLEPSVNSGTVLDLNMAFNLFMTPYPALGIIFNANNIQVKSPLRGTL